MKKTQIVTLTLTPNKMHIRIIMSGAIVLRTSMNSQRLAVPTSHKCQTKQSSTSRLRREAEANTWACTEHKKLRETLGTAKVIRETCSIPNMRMEMIGDVKVMVSMATQGEETKRIRETMLSDATASRMIFTWNGETIKRPPTEVVGMPTAMEVIETTLATTQNLFNGSQANLQVRVKEACPTSKMNNVIRRLVASVHLMVANALLQRGEAMTLIHPHPLPGVREDIERSNRCILSLNNVVYVQSKSILANTQPRGLCLKANLFEFSITSISNAFTSTEFRHSCTL